MGLSFDKMADLVNQYHWDHWDVFPDELILAIFWEESTFTNARQIGWKQGAVGFGQVEPSTVTLANLWAQRDYPDDCHWTPSEILSSGARRCRSLRGSWPDITRRWGASRAPVECLRRLVQRGHPAPLDAVPGRPGGDERLQRHQRRQGGPEARQAQLRPRRRVPLKPWPPDLHVLVTWAKEIDG